MHLLNAQPGAALDGEEAVDLGQSPGDLVILSAADTELSALAAARAALGEEFPRLRLANLMHLAHPMSVDLYVDDVVRHARLVLVRLLGGVGYWPYGVEQIQETCAEHGIRLAIVPGDDQPDADLAARCTLGAEACHRLWQYCVHGGSDNARGLLAYASSLIGHDRPWVEPLPLPRAGLYWPGSSPRDVADMRERWIPGAPVAAVVFYRALVQSGNVAAIDALVESLAAEGLNPLPVYCASLKETVSAALIEGVLAEAPPAIVLNTTGFAVSRPGAGRGATPFDDADCPVLQVVLAGSNEQDWEAGTQGLAPRDLAMHVALPEVDGRVLARAVSFKAEARFDALTECPIVDYAPRADRLAFVAELARRWSTLRRTPRADRRVALVLANYPNRDGRIGNGVGLDTPAATVNLLRALAGAGYRVEDLPCSGDELVARLARGPTNAGLLGRDVTVRLARAEYLRFLGALPATVSEAVRERWGAPEADPLFVLADDAFAIPALEFGGVVVGIQPARGYQIDPVRSYHSPDLVPPHGYLAFYAWLREVAAVHAVVHVGKHGNLEWLPGKAVALASTCYPEAALGPMPHVYPFIVNDPGEGTQAKRRAQAVIVDHLTPPLTRAESYGPLAELERLVDEYYEASGVDRRRLAVLRESILDLARGTGLDRDCGIGADEDADAALSKLDGYLCELKELQIRDGLHVLGESPTGERLADLLVALARLPRGDGSGADASLVRAIAGDLALPLDPLDCDLAASWPGPRPDALPGAEPWRTHGDTVERIERAAAALVAGARPCPERWTATRAVIDWIDGELRPAVAGCGAAEIDGVLRALDGRFVAPGPSGAPSRGRPEVLPTGRNFYSVDTRVVPTPAAWHLGWASAGLLVEHHRQQHGEWPRRIALSAWGTANMRTGGDDIAQALALLGVRPRWEVTSRRVVGFEVMPADVLDRPRVDVTLRVSGFFRDAFPAQLDLLDAAVRAVAALDEPAEINPLAAAVRAERDALEDSGLERGEALRRAGRRVFGSKPGAYGAGLQALIDERGWEDEGDLARAYLAWGGYAYGGGADGEPAHDAFARRLGTVEAVVHNQDNREHDLLDSDDYYQFEGGMTAAVRVLSGSQPSVYHNDHSRPESPRVRTLTEEIGRVVRARVVNPKWIRGVMRHGYKGAFEMAATVDYLFAFAATARVVGDHHFDAVLEAYLDDDEVRAFLESHNPAALAEMAARLLEAEARGLWRPRSNSAHARLRALAGRGGRGFEATARAPG